MQNLFLQNQPKLPWPSGLRRQTDSRSFGQKLRWGPGDEFFFQKKKFDLRSNFFFTLFFKPCATLLLLYVAIFLKMAPLFSYEPTVHVLIAIYM